MRQETHNDCRTTGRKRGPNDDEEYEGYEADFDAGYRHTHTH